MNCKITVLVAVYNTESYLRQCLDSLVGQTLEDIQIVCIDDCSTDGSPEILRDYAARDRRILLLRTPRNSGQAQARNLGLRHALGEYTTMLDSDDYLAPDALERAWEALRQDEENDCCVLELAVHHDEPSPRDELVPLPPCAFWPMTGQKAFRLSIALRLHGLYAVRTGIHKGYPYDTSLPLFSDDNTTHFHYLHSRKVTCCTGRYYYRQHAASSVHRDPVRRFLFVDANLQLMRGIEKEAELGNIASPQKVISLYETQRWTNYVGMYGEYLSARAALSPDERRLVRAHLRDIFRTFRPRLISKRTQWKLGYVCRLGFGFFGLQARAYFLLRRILRPGRNRR